MKSKPKDNFPRYTKSLVFTILLMALTFYFIFKNNDVSSLIVALTQINPVYLLIGIATMALFFLCQALCIKLLLNSLGYRVGTLACTRYTLIDYYFSSITPANMGGQPSEIFFMQKDGIKVGASSLVMLIFNGVYHLAVLLVVGFSVLLWRNEILSQLNLLPGFRILFYFGILAQLMLTIAFFAMVFSKKIAPQIIFKAISLGARTRLIKNPEKTREKAAEQIEEYRRGAEFIHQNPKILLAVLALGVMHIALLYSVPYWVYRAMGLSGHPFLYILAMQAILTISIESLPIPGALGFAEGGFIKLYALIFGGKVVMAMLLARGITYHLSLLVGGLVTMFSKKSPVEFSPKHLAELRMEKPISIL